MNVAIEDGDERRDPYDLGWRDTPRYGKITSCQELVREWTSTRIEVRDARREDREVR
jgi:hypothetical protein